MIDRQRFETLLGLIGIFVFLLGIGAGWVLFPIFSGETLVIAIVVMVMILLGLGFVLSLFFQAYIYEARRLAEEMQVISTVNASHRVQPEGPLSMRVLTNAINTFADRFQTIQENQAEEIAQANANLEAERNRLAALMSELTAGVIVCNIEGQILLYNARARQLLTQSQAQPWAGAGGGLVGLGRSVFGVIERHSITHALEDVIARRKRHSRRHFSDFVTSAANGQLIRARLAPVPGAEETLNGFVLTLEDVTHQSERSNRRDQLLQTLTEGSRAGLANIRAAIETMAGYPAMDTTKRQQLETVIIEEASRLSERLNQLAMEHADDMRADWQFEQILGDDLLWPLQRRFNDQLGIETHIQPTSENLWLKVDSYLVVQTMISLMARLQNSFNVEKVSLRLNQTGQLAALDLLWQDGHADTDALWQAQNQVIAAENGKNTHLTLREVAEHHGGEVWCQNDPATGQTFFRLLLPITAPQNKVGIQVTASHSRPEYYDFDLFHQAGQKPELDQRNLFELAYTVFDTETTGLNPSTGDEIISIGAARVLNGRVLRQEIFDQLIDPQRSLTQASIDITGINPDMLTGQPTIGQVLPAFHQFVERTVLVAHNAAFDMRFLQLKETKTGIKFTNPVLDTLLLSAAIHPNQDDHSLEAIAARLGINIIGRHTALGDAILTGEVFLKLIPLLAAQGIHTLEEAREAAQATYMARIKY